MTFTYELTSPVVSPELQIVKRSDGLVILPNPNDNDYLTYVAWLEAGNKPAADLAETVATYAVAEALKVPEVINPEIAPPA